MSFDSGTEDSPERATWLAERRREVEVAYDEEGPTYDAYDPATSIHRRFVAALIRTVPEGGSIVDIACGTAPYAGMVLDAGLRYTGTDQSNGMLTRASAKWPVARFERIGCQELTFDSDFDAVMCIDAMENISPEDWPSVLGSFHRALRPGGHVYLTVEQIDTAVIKAALETARDRGWPVVAGEVIEGDTAGYHFYPDRDRVFAWIEDAGFALEEEADEWLDGYGYHHMLLVSKA